MPTNLIQLWDQWFDPPLVVSAVPFGQFSPGHSPSAGMVLPVFIEVIRVMSAPQAGHFFPNGSTGRYGPFNRLPGGVARRP